MSSLVSPDGLLPQALSALCGLKSSGNGWMARCPVHDDSNASLSISIGEGGKVLMYCHAGCSFDSIRRALGIDHGQCSASPRAPSKPYTDPPDRPKTQDSSPKVKYLELDGAIGELAKRRGQPAARWDYHNAAGDLVGLILRWNTDNGNKDIRPISRCDSASGPMTAWACCAMPEPRPLYRLPEVIPAETVVVTEGEKCADAAVSLGYVATTSTNGAEAPKKTDWSPLAGKSVVILPDNDKKGEDYAELVANIVTHLSPPATVKIVRLPGLSEKEDIAGWIEPGKHFGDSATLEDMRGELDKLIVATAVWSPSASSAIPATPRSDSAEVEMTDSGSANEFAKDHAEKVRYIAERGWHVWTGTHWERDILGAVVELGKATALRVGTQAKALIQSATAASSKQQDLDAEMKAEKQSKHAKRLLKHSIRMRNKAGLNPMIDLARSLPGITTSIEQFDQHHLLLNVLNGTIDLRNGELSPHRKEDNFTRCLEVAYDPDAAAPHWKRFLAKVFGNDPELIRWIQRWFGWCLSGDFSEHAFDVGRFVLSDELDWSAEQVQDQEKANVTLETLELVGSHEVGDTHMRPGIPSLVRGAEFYHVQPVVLDPPQRFDVNQQQAFGIGGHEGQEFILGA